MMILLAAMAAEAPSSPAPSFDTGSAMIEESIRSSLKDPDSAKFSWRTPFVWGSYKPTIGRRSIGWVVCGTVNAKNSYGGYTGDYAVIGVIGHGVIVAVDMDQPGRWSAHAGWVADQCRKNGVPVL
jgi:hypothetical protein